MPLDQTFSSFGKNMLQCLLLDAADLLGLVIGFWWQRCVGSDMTTVQTERHKDSQESHKYIDICK